MRGALPGKKQKDIIIRKKGDSKEKTTIVIDGDKVTINGKPAEDYKDDDVEIMKEQPARLYPQTSYQFSCSRPQVTGRSDLARQAEAGKDITKQAAALSKKYDELIALMCVYKPRSKGGIGFGFVSADSSLASAERSPAIHQILCELCAEKQAGVAVL